MGENMFCLNRNTRVESDINMAAVTAAVTRFYRDLEMTLSDTQTAGGVIQLQLMNLLPEQYCIKKEETQGLTVYAGDELGFVYGLLYISEKYLGISPFWFWNDQQFCKREVVLIDDTDIQSVPAKVGYRGWFINDEVLITHWTAGKDEAYVWEMTFEALLRCGGNMVIPGTDENSRRWRGLASQMGLWITQHHAEPLGAEMFSRAYPDLEPSYALYPKLFEQLWKQGVEEQKDLNVVWNLGFRGQGDCPFWSTDPQYNTSQSRGELISRLIKLQYDIVCSMIDNPVCCTNLYGETMELYQDGFISLPENIIKIWADNGYGKMVSRRQGNNNPRVFALPERNENNGNHHGLYYHVSFYDLQAANHITMLPNTLTFVEKEITDALDRGVDDYIIINSSNIKSHIFYLDALSQMWRGTFEGETAYAKDYVYSYFTEQQSADTAMDLQLIQDIADCFLEYPRCTIPYGICEDDHAGEQFTNYTTRTLASEWMKGGSAAQELLWATGNTTFEKQMEWYDNKCKIGLANFEQLHDKCSAIDEKLTGHAKQLFEDTIFLQVKLQLFCIKGGIEFCKAFYAFAKKDYKESFYLLGQAAEYYTAGNQAMRDVEHDRWKGYYSNDCLTDVKFTAYLLQGLMSYVRNMGDGPHFFHWQRDYMYSEKDRKVVLITNMDNHPTDWELYEAMKKGDCEIVI